MIKITLKRDNHTIKVKKVNRTIKLYKVGRPGKDGSDATNLVTSVNGKQGVVVLDAADVNADASGSAAQALQDANLYTDDKVEELDSELATVAKTGSYNDLSDKPDFPEDAVTSVNGRTGAVTGLAEASDVATSLNTKVDKVTGKQLSTEDYTTAEKTKLAGIASGAEVNVNADWNASSGDAQILNKPTIPVVDYPVTSVNGREGDVTGLAEKAELDMVENELFQDLTDGDAATLASANSYTNAGLATKADAVATATALDGKANFPTTNSSVPVRGIAGAQASIGYSDGAVNGSLARRTGTGQLKGATAVGTDDLVPKAQMDAADALKVDKAGVGPRLYGTDNAGAETLITYSQNPGNMLMAQRTSGGQLRVGTAALSDAAPTLAQMQAADTATINAHLAAADPHPQYINADRGDARYAASPYSFMAKSEFATLSSSYGMLGKIFGNAGYANDFTVYGKSTQASVPTPDVPVPIVSTTGNQTVKSNGKNLFDKSLNIVTGFFLGVGDVISPQASEFYQDEYIRVKPLTTYIFSNAVLSALRVHEYGPSKAYIGRTAFGGVNTLIVTTSATTEFVRLSGTTDQLNNLQFEFGNVKTSYESYLNTTQTLPLGTTQLRSLPNGVSDRIYKSGSSWFLEQNVISEVYSSSSGWTSAQGLTSVYRFVRNVSNVTNTPNGSTAIQSNMFSVVTQSYNGDLQSYYISGQLVVKPLMSILDPYAGATPLDKWNTFLGQNNLVINMQAVTPVVTTITDQTLITALENIRTYQGITNITASTPVSGSYGTDVMAAINSKVNKTGDNITGILSSTAPSLGFAQTRGGNTMSLGTAANGTFAVYSANGNATILSGTSNSLFGFGTSSATHTLTLPSTATGIALYNTADQVTNYERLRINNQGNVFYVLSEQAGTGSARAIQLSAAGTTNGLIVAPSSSLGLVQSILATGTSGAIVHRIGGSFTASSGSQQGLRIDPTINQAGAAEYTALLINPTETATGSGAKNLIDAQVGGSSKFRVANDGRVNINGADHITGTGFPNGVVSAPVGSIYIDTAVTNGASSWIKKSGTGNSGWSVLEGDTGWRNVNASLINGWSGVSIRVRRVNETVYWGFEALNASSSTSLNLIIIPTGFRPTGIGPYVDRQFLTTATGPAAVYRVTLSGDGPMAVQNWMTTIPLMYGALVSSTVESWPTSLPGTAIA